MSERSGRQRGSSQQISRWEWVSAAIGAILVFGAVGIMLYDAFTGSNAPPTIEISVDTIVPGPSGFEVRFLARNRGDRTAASVQIEGELVDGDVSIQKAQTTIDYLPERGSRTAGLFFQHDPRRYTLRIRPVGYDEP